MVSQHGRIEQLYIYPIKSCRGIPLTQAKAGPLGFEHDRRWMLIDGEGRFLTQRKLPKMALISVELVPQGLIVRAPGMSEQAISAEHKMDEKVSSVIWGDAVVGNTFGSAINEWFSAFLGLDCRLIRQDDSLRQVDQKYAVPGQGVSFADGFPYLLTNRASLEDLNSRLKTPVSMNNFRPNIVVSYAGAFAEDRWRKIRLGAAAFEVKKPCARCILTTVDPETGVKDKDKEPFATLKSYRQKGEQGVLFGQNLIAQDYQTIAVNDPVSILEAY